MKRFLKELFSKENWKKANDLLAFKDLSLSRPFKEKYEGITVLLATLIALVPPALILIIYGIIKHFIG
jgi:uncharacterized membrane protein (DUF106 family)